MKKLLISLVCIISSLYAYAEQGDITIGAHLYDNPKIEGNAIGGGLSCRYSFTDNLRAKLSASFLTVSGESGIDASLDVQWAFTIGDNISLYPAFGAGFLNCGEVSSPTILFGAGAEYHINEQWGIGLDARAQVVTDGSGVGFPIALGVTYTF